MTILYDDAMTKATHPHPFKTLSNARLIKSGLTQYIYENMF